MYQRKKLRAFKQLLRIKNITQKNTKHQKLLENISSYISCQIDFPFFFVISTFPAKVSGQKRLHVFNIEQNTL